MEQTDININNKNIKKEEYNNNKSLMTNQKNIILQNETLYVNHLNEKIKTDLLRENLYYLFSQYGDVLEINLRKSRKMKGQAFIVYKDINDASRAKVSLNNFLFLGTRINVEYAKSKSDIIVKIKGQSNINNQEYQKNGNYLLRKRKRLLEYENIKEEKKEKIKNKENKEIMEDIVGKFAQQIRTEGVHGGNLRQIDPALLLLQVNVLRILRESLGQLLRDSGAQLRSGLPGERDQQEIVDVAFFVAAEDPSHQALNDYFRLSGTGCGGDQDRPAGTLHSKSLRRRQFIRRHLLLPPLPVFSRTRPR